MSLQSQNDPVCPLCHAPEPLSLPAVHGRRYLRCTSCMMAFMHPAELPTPQQERAHYDHHQNSPADVGYRTFLSRLVDPLAGMLRPGMCGLDYGCGPGPTLSVMLRERGFDVADYDPFYRADAALLGRSYDFVTCTEVVEHLHRPADEFARLNALLRPGGLLAVMTEMMEEDSRFATWWYARDPTHVCFYKIDTMRWLAGRFAWTMHRPHKNVVIFGK